MDAAELRALLQELGNPAAAVSREDAAAAHAVYLRRLGEVEAAVQRCDAFLDRFGSNAEVARVLNRLRQKPGGRFFTSSEIVEDLERAVGQPIDLSHVDIELCVQMRDQRVGAKPGNDGDEKPATFAAIDASLRKCLSTLNAIGPNAAGTAILQRLGRRIGDETFTSPARLAALERAVGRRIQLTPGELETCVDAYDVHTGLENILVGDHPPPCGSGESLCPRSSSQGGDICCSSSEVCKTLCSGTACADVCENNTPSCFPGDATVQVEDGTTKAMREVRLGDRLLVARADGTLGYEEVYLNTHKDGTSSGPYVVLTLASGRALTLSPRHFIPVASGPQQAWAEHVVKGADEVRAGDHVWSQAGAGEMVLDQVAAAETKVAVGAYNPLTLGGTIVVDGVVASAHSDWFLDGVVSADTEAKVYQAVLAPVRVAYAAIGPAWMETATEEWGVVDFVREATTPGGRGIGLGWAAWLALPLLVGGGLLVLRRRRAAAR